MAKQYKAHLLFSEGAGMSKRQKTSNRFMPLILIGAGAVLVLAVLIWQVVTPQVPTAAPNIPYPNVPRVSLNEAKGALERKEAVMVDVRDAEYYQTGHISGSINIPLGDLETRYRELNPNQWIILYCT
jgi:hypothetical protein